MSEVEKAKKRAAIKAVQENFDPKAEYVGIGSGTTIVYVVEAIKSYDADLSNIKFVPTGYQSREVIVQNGLTPISFDTLPPSQLMDLAFDGADEVDEDLNCIKGGGACLYQEKLVATHAKKFICVADHRKLQRRLLSKWPSIPIEVEPLAVSVVTSALKSLGSSNPVVRTGVLSKAGPIKTDQHNFIIDAPFQTLLLPRDLKQTEQEAKEHPGRDEHGAWEVEALAKEIKMIEGVLSVGIFAGENGEESLARGSSMGGQAPVTAYFGMEDGSVVKRVKGKAPEVVPAED